MVTTNQVMANGRAMARVSPTVADVVAAFLEAAKATRKPPDDREGLNPDGVQLRRFEKEGEEAIAKALDKLFRDLFRGVDRSNVQQLANKLDNRSITKLLRDTIMALVEEWALAGADFGREQVEGMFPPAKAVKQAEPIQNFFVLANDAASEWALEHGSSLVTDVLDHTRDRINLHVAHFVDSQETINELAARLEPTFGSARARMIAVTEVTADFAQGNLLAWKESGVIEGKEWRTNEDADVEEICEALNGDVVPLDDDFDGGFDGPPAHVGCRCWIVPVPIEATTQERRRRADIAEEIALIEGATPDAFANISPPAGRAPAGLGAEYAARRRIVSRLQTQIKFRGQSQRQLDKFRGQTGARIRFRVDVQKERVRELNKGISTMFDIANDPITDDWLFKSELIDGIIEHISASRAFAA